MVLLDQLFSVFALYERKNRKRKQKRATGLPQAEKADCVTRTI